MQICKVIAEIGCSHLGQFDRAKDLIKLAYEAGADFAKFQKRCPEESVPAELRNKPHPTSYYSYGETYLEHRKHLELSIGQHAELKKYCEQLGIAYATSVWDLTSAREVIELNPTYIKVPSACNCDLTLLSVLYGQYNGDVHISLGMVTKSEIDRIIQFVKYQNGERRTVLYHCTSQYPCPFDRLHLLDIEYLQEKYAADGFRIGFSNHGYGIAADLVAWMLGAEWIERHFVDDRAIRHTDAAASLEPDGLRKLCRDFRNIRKAMTHKDELSAEEKEERRKLSSSRTLFEVDPLPIVIH